MIDHFWDWTDALRLLIALVLGATIGFERELHDKPAGLKTISLVTLSGALVTLFSLHLAQLAGGKGMIVDSTRIPAAVMTGIGFLGAGTILQSQSRVRGITTASVIWLMTGVGMAVGAGMYGLALGGYIGGWIALSMDPVTAFVCKVFHINKTLIRERDIEVDEEIHGPYRVDEAEDNTTGPRTPRERMSPKIRRPKGKD